MDAEAKKVFKDFFPNVAAPLPSGVDSSEPANQ
jgi:hypothetical protein